eukprot:GGOE01020450.1.p1 GENE.GGOE01020450.1~~GGOE01020450.1.p1  ORF type:complete len:368 (+),score=95.13 GGOE01020450.1:85-1188(+)
MHYDMDGGGHGQRRSLVWPFIFCFLLCRMLMPLPPERAHRDFVERVSIVCLSDTNGQHRKVHIPKADILIHSGNFARTASELADFDAWLATLKVGTRIVIAGDEDVDELDYSRRDPKCLCCPVGPLLDVCPNERVRECVCDRRRACCAGDSPDRWDQSCVDLLPRCGVRCASCYPNRTVLRNAVVLQDTQIIVEGLKIYGTSWQSAYSDRPFYVKRGKRIAEKWAAIPEDVDVLVTHVPPYGRGDRLHSTFVQDASSSMPRTLFRQLHRPHSAKRVVPPTTVNDTLSDGSPAGDHELLLRTDAIKPRLHVFGQSASGRGVYRAGTSDLPAISINAVVIDPEAGDKALPPYMWPLRRLRKLQNPIHIE